MHSYTVVHTRLCPHTHMNTCMCTTARACARAHAHTHATHTHTHICVQITKKVPLQRKQVDDVLGGEEAWKNVAKTDGEAAHARMQVHMATCKI